VVCGSPEAPKGVSMLFIVGVDSKVYWGVLLRGAELPGELCCPAEGCSGEPLRGHGWHRRYLDSELVELRRTRCIRCGVTHVILPEDVCAWRDLSLHTVELAAAAGGGPTAGARAARQEDDEGVRRVRRWYRRFEGGWVSKLLALLPAGPGTWWQRVVATAGEPPGALVRLRRWLWSVHRVLLTGVSGLLRHGRPWHLVRGCSTDIGNFSGT